MLIRLGKRLSATVIAQTESLQMHDPSFEEEVHGKYLLMWKGNHASVLAIGKDGRWEVLISGTPKYCRSYLRGVLQDDPNFKEWEKLNAERS